MHMDSWGLCRGCRQTECRRQCGGNEGGWWVKRRKKNEWRRRDGGERRNLVAPPVNLRVRVVAAVAVTGVEVSKSTWDKKQSRELKVNKIKESAFQRICLGIGVCLYSVPSVLIIRRMIIYWVGDKWKHQLCRNGQILTSSKASGCSMSCLVASSTSSEPSSVCSSGRLTIITCSKPSSEPGGENQVCYLYQICINKTVQHLQLEKTKTFTWQPRFRVCLPLGTSSAGGLMLVFIRQALKPRGNFLFGLYKDVQQVFSDVPVLIIEERCGQSYRKKRFM